MSRGMADDSEAIIVRPYQSDCDYIMPYNRSNHSANNLEERHHRNIYSPLEVPCRQSSKIMSMKMRGAATADDDA